MSEPDQNRKPTLWQVIASVNAAFFGVQSRKNRERDFTHGRPLHFIVIGVVMTVVLIAGLVLIVKFMLRNAGL
ncbi:MAG: DUF2970 domain-containing protein [Nevskiaceae bacterium]|nr:MAG: DUF2970 domain-containing protein [Nevskiaceae bacterium]